MEKQGLEPQVCLTLPLLQGTDGVQKMSKSYGNAVGLTDPPDEMFGKLMSIPDELTAKYYRLATPLSVEELDEVESEIASGAVHPGLQKRRLARTIVELYHGEQAAIDAAAAFDRVFKRREAPAEVAVIEVEATDPVHVPALLKELGFASSNAEGRRLVDGGGVKIDGKAVSKGTYDLPWEAVSGRVVQAGKRHFARPVPRS
jgi:tyrosyl-tRNA synthetase